MSKDRKKQLRQDRRAERIAAMLRTEAALRDRLESLHRQGKELAHHAHYDQLGKEAGAAACALAQEITAAIKEGMELHGQCCLENFALSCECQRLESEINSRKGGPSQQQQLDQIDTSCLTPEQIKTLRFALALTTSPDAKQVEAALAGRGIATATQRLDTLRTKVEALKSTSDRLRAVIEEKARRGWLTQEQLEASCSRVIEKISATDRVQAELQRLLEDAARSREELLQKHHALSHRLTQP